MVIGIDLGTTNSLVSCFQNGQAVIIPNRLNKHLTPSIVGIDENGEILVGETARELMALDPERTVSVFKRSMGSSKIFKLDQKKFTAEEISSFVLRVLKEDAEHYLGEMVTEAVISVPAYFNDVRRKATKRAGELAGLKVERIISEPTAAAIAYGLYQKKLNTKFLVFDLGGGTFDVSILELFHHILEVRAVAGDNFLGGEDFTSILMDKYLEDKELDKDRLDQKTLVQIRNQAEQCKIGFSQDRISQMQCYIDNQKQEWSISLEEYEQLCEPLLERIRTPIKRSLSDANIKISDIDEIVLVGGATKLPVIRRFISKLFRRLPDTSVNPDEAVALGAAIQAAMKERKEAIKEVILTDVCPFTLGTEVVVEREGKRFEGGHFCPIIERNTVIPASRTERLYTVHDYQSSLRVQILQGESRFSSNNLYLGELVVEVPKNKAGEESIDVTYTYDINSILEVEVTVISTGKKKRQIIKNQENQMTDEEIEARMKELSYLKIHPRDQEENKLLLIRSDRLFEETTGLMRMQVEQAVRKFEAVLERQDPVKIREARVELKKTLDQLEKELY